MGWEEEVIEEAENQISEEEFDREVARVKCVLEDKQYHEKKLKEIHRWLELYRDGKNPVLNQDALDAHTFNELK